jgi:hypothetical protein
MAFSDERARELKERVGETARLMAQSNGLTVQDCLSEIWSCVREALGRPYDECADEDLPIALEVLKLKSYSGDNNAI